MIDLSVFFFYFWSSVTPFNPNQNESEIPSRVLAGRIVWPRQIDEPSKAFIKKLLNQNPDKRLGSGRNGSREVKEQPIFASIKWDDVYARKMKPPIVPSIRHPGDTSCFDQYQEDWRSAPFASDNELALFASFWRFLPFCVYGIFCFEKITREHREQRKITNAINRPQSEMNHGKNRALSLVHFPLQSGACCWCSVYVLPFEHDLEWAWHILFNKTSFSFSLSSCFSESLYSDWTMTSDERHPNEALPLPSSPTTILDYSRSVSQDLRDLDDALTHAIDQLTKFNSETMSDLSLKYELMRNNEVIRSSQWSDDLILRSRVESSVSSLDN